MNGQDVLLLVVLVYSKYIYSYIYVYGYVDVYMFKDYLDDGSDPETASSSVGTDDGGERLCT